MMKRGLLILTCAAMLFAFAACSGSGGGETASPSAAPSTEPSTSSAQPPAESSSDQAGDFQVAIMAPGIVGENPIFQMLVAGVEEACAENGLPAPNLVEGGEDWDAYGRLLDNLADTGEYDLIVTFTDYMCDNVLTCAGTYPDQKILLIDGDLSVYTDTIPSTVYSVRYKEEDLGYIGGYFCGLVTQSDMERANEDSKVGLVFTAEYDPWEQRIKPCFINGAKDAGQDVEVISSIVGDWVDANKGAETARSLFAQGVDIIWYTSGASTYGCVTEAQAQEKYAVANDNNAISTDPETIVGCTLIQADGLAHDLVDQAIKGTLEYGTANAAGADKGIITFTFDDPVYMEKVPQDIRDAMTAMYEKLAAGEIDPTQGAAQ